MTSDTQIADILAKYDETMTGNVWWVQNRPVIYHKTLERIAARAGIIFDSPVIVRAERDEAVILVTGRRTLQEGLPPGAEPGKLYPAESTELVEWSIGEALVSVNYRVSGKQAAYVFAMAEKRAKDRVIS
jgi:hypothetical protein